MLRLLTLSSLICLSFTLLATEEVDIQELENDIFQSLQRPLKGLSQDQMLHHAIRTLEKINRLSLELTKAYKKGKIEGSRASALMDSAYFMYASLLWKAGELESAVTALDQANLYNRGTSAEANRVLFKGILFKLDDPQRTVDIYTEYTERADFFVGTTPKIDQDADILLSLADAQAMIGNYGEAVSAYEDYIEWVEANPRLHLIQAKTVISNYKKIKNQGKGRLSEKRLAALVKKIDSPFFDDPERAAFREERRTQTAMDDEIYARNFENLVNGY
ncbi:MAG: hypothetical protein QNK37_17985 [Acidobacteriota bacterium]|nr:hypothetical protein [Acidobacteriota bacterium]